MNVLPLRVRTPISMMRLTGSAVTGVGFGLLIYLASASHDLVAFCVYLLLGVTMGAVLGWYETKLVLSRIKDGSSIFLWQLTVATVVLVALPFAGISLVYGFSESRYFLIYTVLSAIPLFLGASGLQYRKYEKQNNVQVYSEPYGFRYYIEPVQDYSNKLYYFLRDIESRDSAAMWQHIGFGKIYQKELEKQPNLSIQTKENISKILKTFRNYRIVALTILGIIVFGWPLLMLFSFTSGFGLLHMPLNAIMNITMPILGASFVAICVSVFLLTRSLRTKMAKALPQIKIERKQG